MAEEGIPSSTKLPPDPVRDQEPVGAQPLRRRRRSAPLGRVIVVEVGVAAVVIVLVVIVVVAGGRTGQSADREEAEEHAKDEQVLHLHTELEHGGLSSDTRSIVAPGDSGGQVG